MKIKVLASGSKGNSTYIESHQSKILIDIGINYLTLQNKLNEIAIDAKTIDAIFITHTHTDHIKGLASLVKKNKIPVYGSPLVIDELTKIISQEYLHVIDRELTFQDIEIETIPLSHDAEGTVGYKMKMDQENLVYITDTGYVNERLFKRLTNASVYIIESNHDEKMLMNGPYPYYLKQRVVGDSGHLSNYTTATYLTNWIGPKTKYVILAHLSENNNTEEVAYETVHGILVEAKKERPLVIAKQREATPLIEV